MTEMPIGNNSPREARPGRFGGAGLAFALLASVGGMALLGRWLPVGSWVETVVEPVRAWGWPGVVVFVAVYALGVVLMLPGLPMTLAGGVLYGPLLGTVVVSIASTLGASLAFLISRTLARERVQGWVAESPRLQRLDAAMVDRGAWVVLLLRLTPLVPFNLLNYALGACAVHPVTYILASMAGMLPATAFYVMVGASFGLDARDISPEFKLILLGISMVMLIGLSLWAKKLLRTIEKDSA